MKKAVIRAGSKQYLVSEDAILDIDLIKTPTKKTVNFKPLLVIDGEKTSIGAPELDKASVTAEIVGETKTDKTTSIRYKAKKRVHTTRGHRQLRTTIQIKKILNS